MSEPVTLDPTPHVEALILCGGQGRRMGGQDKGLLPVPHNPTINAAEYLIDYAHQTGVQRITISANRNLAAYGSYGHPVISDGRAGFQGPLAGIEAGLKHCLRSWLWVLPCDTTPLPAQLLQVLFKTAIEHHTPVVWAIDDERDHHAICLVHRSQQQAISQRLDQGSLSLRHWQTQQGGVGVAFADFHFFNRNTTHPDSRHRRDADTPTNVPLHSR